MGLTEAADDKEVLRALLSRAKTRSFGDVSVVGADQEQQIIRYDQEAFADLRVLFQPFVRGSIFRRSRIWWQIVAYWFLASIIAVLFYRLVPEPAKINSTGASTLSTYFNMFLPFLFGIYLNNTFTRWWAMRADGVGMVNNSINSLCVIMASWLRGAELTEAKHLMLRYGLLSHELIYRSVRKTDGDLSDLIASGLLKPEEMGLLMELNGASSKAQAVWVWIQILWDAQFQLHRIPPQVHQVVLEHISQGRTAVKRIFTFINTQMPFAYVHLMACLVHLNLFVLALQAGIIVAKCFGKFFAAKNGAIYQSSDTEAGALLFTQCFFLTMVPMIYLGFLELTQEISDPFGTDLNDFPRAQFHNVMHDENESFFRMAECVPPALLAITIKPEGDERVNEWEPFLGAKDYAHVTNGDSKV